jgi:AAA family ATPase
MASLVSKKFVIGLANFSEPTRAARRIIINADVVKAVKLCAGDVVALSDSGNVDNTKVSTQWFQRFCLRETT